MREQGGLDGQKLPGLPITASSKLGGPRHSPTYQPIVVHILGFFPLAIGTNAVKSEKQRKLF